MDITEFKARIENMLDDLKSDQHGCVKIDNKGVRDLIDQWLNAVKLAFDEANVGDEARTIRAKGLPGKLDNLFNSRSAELFNKLSSWLAEEIANASDSSYVPRETYLKTKAAMHNFVDDYWQQFKKDSKEDRAFQLIVTTVTAGYIK